MAKRSGHSMAVARRNVGLRVADRSATRRDCGNASMAYNGTTYKLIFISRRPSTLGGDEKAVTRPIWRRCTLLGRDDISAYWDWHVGHRTPTYGHFHDRPAECGRCCRAGR